MPTEKLTLGAYGKLPLSKEFLRVACVGPAVPYMEWLDRGSASRTESDPPFESDWYRRILFVSPDGKDVVISSIRDSFDEGGERRFPFTVFVTLKARMLRGLASGGLALALEPFWEALEDRIRDLTSQPDVAGFHQESRSPLKISWDARSAQRQFEFSARACPVVRWGGGLPDGTSAVRLLWRTRQLFQRLRLFQDPAENVALRVPTSEHVSSLVQTDLWLHLVHRCLGTPTRLPSLVLTPTELDEGSVAIVCRPLLDRDFSLLGQDARSPVDGLVDLCVEEAEPPSEGYSDFHFTVHKLLGRSDSTLANLAEWPLV